MSGVKEEQEEYRRTVGRSYGSTPWLKLKEVKSFKAKVFKSGNSLALRLPAGLGLIAGMEMELRVEDGVHFSFGPADRPKAKFNVAKVWGSATSLKLIKPEDRVFAERSLVGSERSGENPGGGAK